MALIISIGVVAIVCAWLGWKKRIILGLFACLVVPAGLAAVIALCDHPERLRAVDVGKIVFLWLVAVAIPAFGWGALCRFTVERFGDKDEPKSP